MPKQQQGWTVRKTNVVHILAVLLAVSLILNCFQGWANAPDRHYPLLAKRIFSQRAHDIIINFQPLREQLRAYPRDHNVDMGIYFEYLPSGTSIGVNDRDIFFSASLIKLPLAMRTYHLVNEGKLKLNQEVILDNDLLDDSFGSLYKRGAGSKVTVEELVRYLLVESDNTAFRALVKVTESNQFIDGETKLVNDVYDYLDLPFDKIGNEYGVSPKSYSSILRSLYLSAYLPYKDSSQLLELMSQSTFTNWLAEPIPAGIKVAHKYGIYNGAVEAQLVHGDCGIVYYPSRPYILCAMVRTKDRTETDEHIPAVSKLVLDYVKNANSTTQ